MLDIFGYTGKVWLRHRKARRREGPDAHAPPPSAPSSALPLPPSRRGPEVQPRPLGAAGGGTRGDDASSTGSRSPVRLRTRSGARWSRSVLYVRRGGAGPGRGLLGTRVFADTSRLGPFVLFSLQAPWLRSGPGRCEALAARERLVGVSPARSPGPRGSRSGQCRAEHGSGSRGPGSDGRV